MRGFSRKVFPVAAALLAGIVALSCSETNRQRSPVSLILSNAQTLNIIDLTGGAGCDQDIGTITMTSQVIQNAGSGATVNNSLNGVRLTRYRVSYSRTDGGKLVPAPFVNAMDVFIAPGSNANLTRFLVLQPDARSQAPFAALQPQNGGRDPETGRPFVGLQVNFEVFGETLAGENVTGSTQFPLQFCFDCQGCR